MWQSYPNVKRVLVRRTRSFGGFDHELFYHHALFIAYNVIDAIHNSIGRKRDLGACPQKTFYKCTSDTAGKAPLQAHTAMSEEHFG